MRTKQRYRCKACGLNFTDTPTRGKPLALKVAAVLLYVSGLSMNRTPQLLGVSTPTIQAWLEQFAAAYAQKPEPEGRAVVIELDEMWHYLKKLGWQSWLARLLFQGGQASIRVAAEAGAQGPGLPPALQTLAEFGPSLPATPTQLAPGGWAQPRRRGRDQAHLPSEHGGRGGRLAPAGPALVVALRAAQMLEVVVGARQAGHRVTREQPGSVAAGHLAEVPDGVRERPRLAAVTVQGGDEPVEAAPDKAGVLLAPVVQDVGGPVPPAVGARDVRPERSRALHAAADQLAHPRQPGRAAPFSPTRPRLAATFSSRLLSVRPEAASGGRPSSVTALRTAAQ